MADIRAYLDNHTLPEDCAESEKLTRISKRYVLVEGTLYRRGANGVHLKCIPWEQGIELIADAHEGECGAHSASRTTGTRRPFVSPSGRSPGPWWPRGLGRAP
jgi:hypothetical protein